MKPAAAARATGSLNEKKVVNYAAAHLGVNTSDILFQPLTPDASTRTYYRIASAANPDRTFIVSLYPAPFNPQDSSYLDVTRLFQEARLPVPEVIDVADTEGIILQEDLGDSSLTAWLISNYEAGEIEKADRMLERAIELIAQIQMATDLAYQMGSVSIGLAFDEAKLLWELDYFFDHYFGSYLQYRFTAKDKKAVWDDLMAIAAELSARPRVLTHRDYHGMNLMVDARGDLRIIDHQDARLGPVTYDLVPLLVERKLQPANENWIIEHQDCFLRVRREMGLPEIDRNEFRYEFNLMTVQRQLKVAGTFSYQTAVLGRGEVYEKYIRPSVDTVLWAMSKPGIKQYPALRKALENSRQ